MKLIKRELITFKVTSEEKNEILRNAKKYNFDSVSEYIRTAISFFNERRYNASKNIEIETISDCIKILEKHQKEKTSELIQRFYENDENVLPLNEKKPSQYYKNPEKVKPQVLPSTEVRFYESGEMVLPSSVVDEKCIEEKDVTIFQQVDKTLAGIIATKQKPSDDNFRFIANKIDKTPKEVKNYFYENYDRLEKISKGYLDRTQSFTKKVKP